VIQCTIKNYSNENVFFLIFILLGIDLEQLKD